MKRKVANPLELIAGKQTLGQNDADRLIFPMLAHLEEVRTGHGYYGTIRMVTIYLRAMLSSVNNTATKPNETLIRYIADAGKAWMSSATKCADRGMDGRVVLSGDDWSKLSRAVRMFMMVMPNVPLYIWTQAVSQSCKAWDEFESANHASQQQ